MPGANEGQNAVSGDTHDLGDGRFGNALLEKELDLLLSPVEI